MKAILFVALLAACSIEKPKVVNTCDCGEPIVCPTPPELGIKLDPRLESVTCHNGDSCVQLRGSKYCQQNCF